MTVIAIIPALAAVIGLLIYVLAANTKVQELGRLTFLAGLLVTLYALMGHTVKL